MRIWVEDHKGCGWVTEDGKNFQAWIVTPLKQASSKEDSRRGEVETMLVTAILLKSRPQIDVRYGQTTWIDIDDLHLQLSTQQYERLLNTMEKAVLNSDQTITAQW